MKAIFHKTTPASNLPRLLRPLVIITFFLASVTLVHGQSINKATAKKIRELDKTFNKSLVDFNVPGMGIAIVYNDEVVLSKGYGVKNSTTGEPVDANTLFAIASNSKAFTAASLAMLVDSSKINWTDKVTRYLPYFRLYSPYVTEEMTVRDLLCHRTGLATFSGDLVWYGTDYSREEVIRRAALLEPVYGFREQWGYSNIMFLAAGEIIPAVTGLTWDEYVKKKILDPAGMSHTNTSITSFQPGDNIASPHNEVNGKNIPIDYVNWDNIGPAGSINSCAADMSQWLRLQLGQGMLDGKSFWNADRSWEMWENQTPRPVSRWQRENMPLRHFSGYGLGWELSDYGGVKVISHGGGYDGMISKTVLVPELNLGFVIMTNNINSLSSCLTYVILDQFVAHPSSKNWPELFLDFKKQDDEAAAKNKEIEASARIQGTSPSLKLADYAGTYSSELYGDVIIGLARGGGELTIDFVPTPLFSGKLSPWHYDTFELQWDKQMMLPPGKVTFILTKDGVAGEIRIDVPNPDFDFSELKLFRKNL